MLLVLQNYHIETHYPLYPVYLGTGSYRAKYILEYLALLLDMIGLYPTQESYDALLHFHVSCPPVCSLI